MKRRILIFNGRSITIALSLNIFYVMAYLELVTTLMNLSVRLL